MAQKKYSIDSMGRSITTKTYDINGETKRKYYRGWSDSEVDKKIKAFEKQLLEDSVLAKERTEKGRLFTDVADEWKEKHDSEVRYNTSNCYIAPVKDVKAHFEGTFINDISSDDIQSFITKFAKSGADLKPKARQTVKLRLMVLSMIFDYEKIRPNPADGIKLPKNLKAEKREAPSEEIIAKIKSNVDAPFGLYPFLLINTGLRRSEALALTREDFDFERNTISINKQIEFHGDIPVVVNFLKSDAGSREIPLLKTLKEKLPKWSGALFKGKNSEHMRKMEFYHRWEKLGFSGNDKVIAHQMRHGYATMLFEANVPVETAMVLLGHSSISVTTNIYTTIRNSQKQKAADLLNKYNDDKSKPAVKKYRVARMLQTPKSTA